MIGSVHVVRPRLAGKCIRYRSDHLGVSVFFRLLLVGLPLRPGLVVSEECEQSTLACRDFVVRNHLLLWSAFLVVKLVDAKSDMTQERSLTLFCHAFRVTEDH